MTAFASECQREELWSGGLALKLEKAFSLIIQHKGRGGKSSLCDLTTHG